MTNPTRRYPQPGTAGDPRTAYARARDLRDSGKPAEAEQILRDLLRQFPDQLALMHDLALALKAQGRLGEAEEFSRKVVAAAPAEPAAHNNLGNLLRARGAHDEAEACFRKAIALKPGYADAHYNLALVFEDTRRTDEALASHREAIRISPDYYKAHVRIGAILNDRAQFAEALAALDDAVALAPDNFDAHYYRGWTLCGLQRFDECFAAFEHAAALRPGSAEALHGLANALQRAGHQEKALEAYQKLIALKPDSVPAHLELNALAWVMDRKDIFLRSFAYARERVPENADLLFAEASLLYRRGMDEQAEAVLRRAYALKPDDHNTAALLGRVLARRGRFEESFPLFEQAIATEPKALIHRHEFGFALLTAKEAKQAQHIFEAAREINPFEQMTLAGLCLAYRELGDSRYEALVDVDNLVRTYEIRVPRGFADAAAFNRVLAEELATLHTTKVEPLEQTLRGGTQTPGQLFEGATGAVAEVRESIREAVADYIRAMPDDSGHPLFMRKANEFTFTGSWSCRLRSSGYHTNHVHPMGWISSAYYVHLPGDIEDEAQHSGWLKFGESHISLGERDRPHRFVKPGIGRLALFPSYFWHGTVPFSSDDYRMTIAFDVVPGIVDVPKRPDGAY